MRSVLGPLSFRRDGKLLMGVQSRALQEGLPWGKEKGGGGEVLQPHTLGHLVWNAEGQRSLREQLM